MQEQYAEKTRKAKYQALSLIKRLITQEVINKDIEREALRFLRENDYQ